MCVCVCARARACVYVCVYRSAGGKSTKIKLVIHYRDVYIQVWRTLNRVNPAKKEEKKMMAYGNRSTMIPCVT